MAGSKKQKRSGVKATVTKLGTSPDFADWNITDIELYLSGLRKRMIGALNEVVRFSLKEGADVRFTGFADGKNKDPLTMIVSFPGMAPGDGCIPPEVKFSLRDALSHALGPETDQGLIRVRKGLLKLVREIDARIEKAPPV
ncbi:MAG TPA: hypothetical protein VK797_21350 [Tepidisphaeraceae bacterium]|nr:hypothetical protein [Tepidisphaeraceae bacterium]